MSQSKQVFYNTVGNFTTLFFQWLIIMIIPKIGNFDDAGVFAVAISISTIMNVVMTFYIINLQLYDKYETYSESNYSTFRVFTTIISVVFCLIAIVVLGYNAKECLVVLAYLTYRIIINFMLLQTTRMQVAERLDLVGKCMIVEGIVSFVTFVTTYYLTKGLFLSTILMALIGGAVYAFSVSFCFRKVMGRGYDYGKTNRRIIIPLCAIGFLLLVPQLVMNLIPSISKIGLQICASNEITGIFSTLTSPTVVIQVFVGAAFAPFVIKFSEMTKKGMVREFKREFAKVIALVLGLGVAGVIVSLLFADFFFTLLYGDSLSQYIYLFHWMVVAITFMSIATCAITVLAMQNRKKVAAVSSTVSAVISIILFAIYIPSGGMEGSTYALVLSNLIFAILTSYCVFVKLPEDDDTLSVRNLGEEKPAE